MTKESLIEWASHWVTDSPPGQRARFEAALRAEMENWVPASPVSPPLPAPAPSDGG